MPGRNEMHGQHEMPSRDDMAEMLSRSVAAGEVAGAVALTAAASSGYEPTIAAAGLLALDRPEPMAHDSIFRISSLTKPIVAAALVMLVEDGAVGYDDPIGRRLPELAEPRVLRAPDSALDDTVAADRPITVMDLLTSRSGWGFSSDFSSPVLEGLLEIGQGALPAGVPAPDEWLAKLARIPLQHQPGEGWLYNASSDLQGLLISRVTDRPLAEVLAERVFEPLGMVDSGFVVPASSRHRFASYYREGDTRLELVDGPDGQWASAPAFVSGAGGLVSTVDDWAAFARMLLNNGCTASGSPLLTPSSVRTITTDHLTAAQRAAGSMFLDGQGWGFGGSVDVAAIDPWNVPGRYGWVGGTGTSAHIVPSAGTISILFTQRDMTGPTPPHLMQTFWSFAAGA